MRRSINKIGLKIGVQRRAIILVTVLWLLVTLVGCEAFVRKFTRKPKDEKKEEMILAPEEYKGPQMSSEELSRQYLLFWKSWHDELIAALTPNANHKKQLYCVKEAVRNLIALRPLLTADKQVELDVYIGQLNSLKDAIISDSYGTQAAMHRQNAERIRRNVLRDFSFRKVKLEVRGQ